MKRIYKYELLITDQRQTIRLPEIFMPVHFGEQNQRLYMWIMHDTDSEEQDRSFVIRGTGHQLGNREMYHASVQMKNGLVWHIFEVKN